MTEAPTDSVAQLQALRQRAKQLGIPNFQVKGYAKLYEEVMAKIDEDAAKGAAEAKELAIKNAEEALKVKAANPNYGEEKYYFTNPATNKVGEYILTDKKNMLPHTDKKTSYRLLRWL